MKLPIVTTTQAKTESASGMSRGGEPPAGATRSSAGLANHIARMTPR